MPMREVAFQGYIFLALVYAGIGCGIACDLFAPLLNSRVYSAAAAQHATVCACIWRWRQASRFGGWGYAACSPG